MHFQADHDFPGAGLALDEFVLFGRPPAPGEGVIDRSHATLHQLAGLWLNPAACSIARPARKTVASSKALPISCRPSGNPLSVRPAGTASPGRPARLTVTVKTSFRYMATGSSLLSPTAKAGPGVAGVSS